MAPASLTSRTTATESYDTPPGSRGSGRPRWWTQVRTQVGIPPSGSTPAERRILPTTTASTQPSDTPSASTGRGPFRQSMAMTMPGGTRASPSIASIAYKLPTTLGWSASSAMRFGCPPVGSERLRTREAWSGGTQASRRIAAGSLASRTTIGRTGTSSTPRGPSRYPSGRIVPCRRACPERRWRGRSSPWEPTSLLKPALRSAPRGRPHGITPRRR